jgi:hypothetical protein
MLCFERGEWGKRNRNGVGLWKKMKSTVFRKKLKIKTQAFIFWQLYGTIKHKIRKGDGTGIHSAMESRRIQKPANAEGDENEVYKQIYSMI